jgi:hypothetical protein
MQRCPTFADAKHGHRAWATIATAGIRGHAHTPLTNPVHPSTPVEFRGGFAARCGLDDVELRVNHWVAPEVRV